MTPHKQLFRHRPKEGMFGDCFRTCIACLLDLSPGDVPHFTNQNNQDWQKDSWEWLAGRGLTTIDFPISGEFTFDQVFEAMRLWSKPGLHFILGGMSKSGCDHAVIATDQGIVWDPSLNNSGIVGPCSDGSWWISCIGRLV